MKKGATLLLLLLLTFAVQSQCLSEDWHSTSLDAAWLSCNARTSPIPQFGVSHWVMYEFEKKQNIKGMHLWNLTHPNTVNSGVKRLRIDASSDGISWQNIGVLNIAKGNSSKEYLGEEFEDLDIQNTQYVVLTVLESHGGTCAGFAEVRFNLGETTTPTNDEILSERLLISPNPADHEITVSLKDINTSRYSYELFDLSGKRLMKSVEKSTSGDIQFNINSSGLPDGLYSLHIQTDEGSVTKKIVIAHPE